MASVAEVLTSTDRPQWRGRRAADLATRLLLGTVTLCLLATITFLLTGGRALVVRSGSMEPAVSTGDMAVTRTITPTEAAVGDVVTFKDPSRHGELVTHRVVKVRTKGDQVAFVTKGDSNTGVEKWKIDSDGKIGRLTLRIPRLGYAVVWVTAPKVRASLIAAAALLFAVAALRRIWAR
jgi:signal peptidase